MEPKPSMTTGPIAQNLFYNTETSLHEDILCSANTFVIAQWVEYNLALTKNSLKTASPIEIIKVLPWSLLESKGEKSAVWEKTKEYVQQKQSFLFKDFESIKKGVFSNQWVILDSFLENSLRRKEQCQPIWNAFNNPAMSLEEIQERCTIFARAKEEDLRLEFPIANRSALYSYLFYRLKMHYNVKDVEPDNDDFCLYNWTKLQFQGFYLLAIKKQVWVKKFVNSKSDLTARETGIGFGICFSGHSKTDADALKKLFEFGPELLTVAFEFALKKGFKEFFNKAFVAKHKHGSYEDRCNQLQEYIVQVMF